jgi:mono/diheme cytochrome c family protein
MRCIVLAAALCFSASAALAFTTQQAAQGRQLFAQHCALCHGEAGQGGRVPAKFGALAGWWAPALVDKAVLSERPPASRRIRRVEFRTAADLLNFIQATMPAQDPGSLREADYLALVAFTLQANGAKPAGKPLTPKNAAAVPLRPAQR